MSPTEDQLRRALKEGEGDGPDPTGIMLRASAYRRERRAKILSTVAIAAVVAGIGSGIGVIVATRGGSASTNSSAGLANGGSADSAGARDAEKSAGASSAVGSPVSPTATTCPLQLPAIPQGEVAAANSAFTLSGAAASVTVCGYLGTGAVIRDATSMPLAKTFRGNDAVAIARSVNDTSATPPGLSCGAIPASGLHSLLVFTQYDGGGNALPVLIGVGCDETVNNGRILRYQWKPPPPLDPFLSSLHLAAATMQPSPTTS